MNKLFASVFVLALMLFAIVICMRQTIVSGDRLATTLLTIEIFIATGLIACIALLLLRGRTSRKRIFSREGFAVVQPLRRLLAAVWS